MKPPERGRRDTERPPNRPRKGAAQLKPQEPPAPDTAAPANRPRKGAAQSKRQPLRNPCYAFANLTAPERGRHN